MARRPLPRVSWPLPGPQRQWLCAQAGVWALEPSEAPETVQVDVVLDLGDRLWLRLQWVPTSFAASFWRWPPQRHVWLRRAQQPADWALLRAHLWPQRRRHWLGAP